MSYPKLALRIIVGCRRSCVRYESGKIIQVDDIRRVLVDLNREIDKPPLPWNATASSGMWVRHGD
jgi:hypothetical protein